MTVKRRHVELDGLFHQAFSLEMLRDAKDAREALLGGDDLPDVLDILIERISFLEQRLVFFEQMIRQPAQELRQLPAFGIVGEESRQIGFVFAQQPDRLGHVRETGLLELFANERGGDIHTVEHIADIVQDVGRDFRFPGFA